MSDTPVPDSALQALTAYDTPTICNAIEALKPEWRVSGFTTETFHCTDPKLRVVGYARTATIRSHAPSGLDARTMRDQRLAYYRYLHDGPRPSMAIIQDLDGVHRGFGSFWGEVQTHAHRALGCVGGVTDGAMRDLDDVASNFQLLAAKVVPSHAWVHLVDFSCQVSVHGMVVDDSDIVHADQHGAVVVPADVVEALPEVIADIGKREANVLDVCRDGLVDFDAFAAGYTRMSGG